MYSRKSPRIGLDLVVLAGLAFLGSVIIGSGHCGLINGYPAANIEAIGRLNKLNEKHDHGDQVS